MAQTALDLLAADELRTERSGRRRELRGQQYVTAARLEDILPVATSSGAGVSESTASTLPIVVGCVGLLADMVAKLPLKLYRPTTDGAAEAREHKAFSLIHARPGDMHTPFELRRDTMAGVGLGGNGFIRVFRDRFYEPAELQWLKPVDVSADLMKRPDGRKFPVYKIAGDGNVYTRADIIHVRGLATDGVNGISPVRAMRESIGLSLTQRKQAAKIYANGARFPGYLSAPAAMTKAQIDESKREWRAAQEGAENAGKTPILWGGWTYTATNGMTMQDAEFLESRKFERAEVATWYRIPEILVGNSEKTSSWGTGVEQITLGFLTTCLDPWLIAWEQSLRETLLTADEIAAGWFFKFNRRALLSVALEAQAKFLREMRDIGVYSVNDCRRYLDENTLDAADGGDDYSKAFNGSGGTAASGTQQDEQPAREAITA